MTQKPGQRRGPLLGAEDGKVELAEALRVDDRVDQVCALTADGDTVIVGDRRTLHILRFIAERPR